MASTRNIIVGAANFRVGPPNVMITGTAHPTAVATDGSVTYAATGGTGGVFTPVGFTSEGVEVSYEPDYGDVEVDQLLDSARIFKQGMRVTVNTTFAEATLENLLVIWGQLEAPVTGNVNIRAGNLGAAPVERSLLFVGPAPVTSAGAQQERIYRIYRGIQTESSSFALRRSEMTGLPASFRCLPDANTSGGASYGTITDRAESVLLTTVV